MPDVPRGRASRTETSTLASLHELRSIENQRVTDERAARDRDRQVREDLAREVARRAEAEAQAARDAALADAARAEAEREAIVRDRETAVACAAATARVQAEAELDAARLAAELELRRERVARTRPVGLIAVLVAVIVVAGGLTTWIVEQRGDLAGARAQIDTIHQQATALRAQEQTEADRARVMTETIDRLHHLVDDLNQQVADAQRKHDAIVPPPPARAPPSAPHRPTAPARPPQIVLPDGCATTSLGCLTR